MHVNVHICVNPCTFMCVFMWGLQVIGQPQELVFTFHLVWDKVSCCILLHTRLAALQLFRHSPVSASYLSRGELELQTCAIMPSVTWDLLIWNLFLMLADQALHTLGLIHSLIMFFFFFLLPHCELWRCTDFWVLIWRKKPTNIK